MDTYGSSIQKQWRPFPELKNAEIVQIMEELKIPLTEADIIKPHPPHIQRIYEIFLELFMGSQAAAEAQRSVRQPNFAVLELLEFPDIHLDAIALISFHQRV
jgi:Nuf2 family